MPCITLISDFGLQDASVAVAKGILLQFSPGMPIVDISHEIKPFYSPQAAYLLSTAWKRFPPRTCHVLLFNLFTEKIARVLLTEHQDHYFLTADNGLLSLAIENISNTWLYHELGASETYTSWLQSASKAIKELQQKDVSAMNLNEFKPKKIEKKTPELKGTKVICDVLHVDRYENVVLNITKQQFESLGLNRPFTLEFAQVEEITEISNNYADVRPGFKLCRFNSSGYMEICINRGNAASLFGLKPGGRKNDIKIIFG
jgi:hypothetical protein